MPDHLSATQIGMFCRCAEQYRFRYMEGLRVPPGISVVPGAALHKGRELGLGTKLETGVVAPAGQVIQRASEAVAERFAEGVRLVGRQWDGLNEHQAYARVNDLVTTLAGLEHAEFQCRYEPLHVEHRLEAVVPSLGINLVGIIDLVLADHAIHDLKVVARRIPARDVEENIQLTCYGLLYSLVKGREASAFALDMVLKQKTPSCETVSTRRTEGHYTALLNRMEAMLNAIEADVWVPCQTDAWWCDPQWCGYFDRCRYTSKGAGRPKN